MNALPFGVQTIIYRHVFDDILHDLLYKTFDIRNVDYSNIPFVDYDCDYDCTFLRYGIDRCLDNRCENWTVDIQCEYSIWTESLREICIGTADNLCTVCDRLYQQFNL